MLLEGKVVLVTGASAGIGRAVAIACARHGANVALNYARDTAGAESAVTKSGDGLARDRCRMLTRENDKGGLCKWYVYEHSFLL